MKLHLPKALFTAVLAAFAVSQTSWAETTREVWVNFGTVAVASDTTVEGYPAASSWNNITGGNTDAVNGTHALVDTTGQTVGSLQLNTPVAPWGPGADNTNVLTQMQSSYLDLPTWDGNMSWTMALCIDDMFAGVSENTTLNLYFAGDKENYAPVDVNGTKYVGGLNTTGGSAWGTRDGSTTMEENNTITLTGTGTTLNIMAVPTNLSEGGGRATISGLSLSYTVADGVTSYSATLAGGANDATAITYTDGTTETAWADIAETNRYFYLSGAEDNSSIYTLAAGTTVKGIQINAHTVSVESAGAITADVLWAKSGATLNLDAQLTTGSSVTMGGAGTINVNESQNLSQLVSAASNLTIAEGATVTLTGTGSSVINLSANGSLVLAEGATLSVLSTDFDFLGNTTGTGAISVASETEILQGVVSDFAGTIEVANYQTLYFGSKANSGQDKGTIDLSEATIQLNGGSTLRVQGKQSQLGKLVALDNATLRMYDGNEVNNAYLTEYTISIGEVTIAANKTLAVEKNWEGHLHIEALNAEGKLDMNHGGNVVVTIESITQSGDIDNAGQTTLGVSGDSVLNLGGDVSNEGTLIIKGQLAGESTISGGTISVADSASVTGNITFDEAITLAGTLSNTGNLTLNRNVSVSALSALNSTGVYSDNEGKDGYMSSAQYVVVSTTGAGTATLADGLKLNDTYTLEKSGQNIVVNITMDEPTGDYYVNTTVDYTAGSVIAADTTTGITMNGGTLNLNTALAEDVSISTAKSSSVINVADGVTLANSSVAAGSTKSTIAGGSTAVYDMGSGWSVEKMAENGLGEHSVNVTFGEAWNGVTLLTNVNIGQSVLDNFTREGGTLKLVGYSGWMSFDSNNNATVNSNLVLENYSNTVEGVTTTKSAFVFDDNSQGKKYNFNGDISGSGDFQIASQASSAATITFDGDTAEWKGGIVVTNAYNSTGEGKDRTNTVDVNLTAGGDIFSADGNKGFVMDRTSTNTGNNIINLNIGNADADSTMNGAIGMGENADERSVLNLTVKGDTTFKKEVEVTSLTVDAGKTATLEATATTNTLTTNGTVELTEAGSLTYGGTTSVSGYDISQYTETTGATITNDAITGGTVSFYSDASVTESRTISNATIMNGGTGTANVKVGDQNVTVYAYPGNIEMTAANGSTSVAQMTIAAGSQVSATGDLTVTSSLYIASTEALSVTGALTLTDSATINLTGLTLQEGVTSYTLGTATGDITLGDVTLSLPSIEGYDVELSVQQFTKPVMPVDGEATSTTYNALVLTLTAQTTVDALTSLTVNGLVGYDATNGVLTLKTEEATLGAVFDSQKDVNVTMSDAVWDKILADLKVAGTTLPSEIALKFQGSDGEYFDFNGTAVPDDSGMPAITINKEIVRGEYPGPNDGTITGNYVTAYIPEPTTTTLSLLALAGLAVRRRRASR
ncbi:MAG: hypothetical protein IKV82_08395 [Akkermansia sp.]|nr:hypothetical protein [Akkermansia sp.]